MFPIITTDLIISRPGLCQGLLYNHLRDSLIHSFSQSWFVKISLRRRHTLTFADGAFSHKIDHVTIFQEILNSKGYPNRITGSKVTAILLKGWILPMVELHREGSASAACAAGLFLLLLTFYYSLSTVYCLLFIVYSLLFDVYC